MHGWRASGVAVILRSGLAVPLLLVTTTCGSPGANVEIENLLSTNIPIVAWHGTGLKIATHRPVPRQGNARKGVESHCQRWQGVRPNPSITS